MSYENPERLPKQKYEQGPMSPDTKAEMVADFTPILEELKRDIAELEARKKLSADERRILKELKLNAQALEQMIADCQDADSKGFIRDIENNN